MRHSQHLLEKSGTDTAEIARAAGSNNTRGAKLQKSSAFGRTREHFVHGQQDLIWFELRSEVPEPPVAQMVIGSRRSTAAPISSGSAFLPSVAFEKMS